ncbi:MAG: bacteriocin fulvocin C-related protein [Acidobacteriota bacterium]
MRRMLVALLILSAAASLNAAAPGGDRPRTAEREAMDTLYGVLATMPVTDRKVVFHGLTPMAKAALWTIHLERFSAEHQLTSEQKALIGQAIALSSPAMYSVDISNPNWESLVRAPLREFEEKTRAVFPHDLAAEAFAQLGPSDVPAVAAGGLTSAGSAPQAEGLSRGLKPVPLLPSECTCSTESDWCWGFSTCGIGGVTCYRSTDGGCGTLWRYDCNSKCSYGHG